jgi:hypothetical protein
MERSWAKDAPLVHVHWSCSAAFRCPAIEFHLGQISNLMEVTARTHCANHIVLAMF